MACARAEATGRRVPTRVAIGLALLGRVVFPASSEANFAAVFCLRAASDEAPVVRYAFGRPGTREWPRNKALRHRPGDRPGKGVGHRRVLEAELPRRPRAVVAVAVEDCSHARAANRRRLPA